MKNLNYYLFLIGFLVSFPLYAKQTLIFASFDSSIMMDANVRIFKEIYRRLGINIIIKNYPAQRALSLANSGELDGDLVRRADGVSLQSNLIKVPTTFIKGKAVAFSKNKNIILKGWESLKPYKIAILRGHKGSEKHTRAYNPEIINTAEELFYFLHKGRADIIIYPYYAGIIHLKKLGITDIYPLSPPLDEVPIYHFLHKKHADLVPKVDKIIQQIIKEGLPEKIKRQVFEQRK